MKTRIIASIVAIAFLFTQCGIGIAAPVYKERHPQNLRVKQGVVASSAGRVANSIGADLNEDNDTTAGDTSTAPAVPLRVTAGQIEAGKKIIKEIEDCLNALLFQVENNILKRRAYEGNTIFGIRRYFKLRGLRHNINFGITILRRTAVTKSNMGTIAGNLSALSSHLDKLYKLVPNSTWIDGLSDKDEFYETMKREIVVAIRSIDKLLVLIRQQKSAGADAARARADGGGAAESAAGIDKVVANMAGEPSWEITVTPPHQSKSLLLHRETASEVYLMIVSLNKAPSEIIVGGGGCGLEKVFFCGSDGSLLYEGPFYLNVSKSGRLEDFGKFMEMLNSVAALSDDGVSLVAKVYRPGGDFPPAMIVVPYKDGDSTYIGAAFTAVGRWYWPDGAAAESAAVGARADGGVQAKMTGEFSPAEPDEEIKPPKGVPKEAGPQPGYPYPEVPPDNFPSSVRRVVVPPGGAARRPSPPVGVPGDNAAMVKSAAARGMTGLNVMPEVFASLIDHTNLNSGATKEEIQATAREALDGGYALVAVRPGQPSLWAAEVLQGSRIKVGPAIGFGLLVSKYDRKNMTEEEALARYDITIDEKIKEITDTIEALRAQYPDVGYEIDFVINVKRMHDGDDEYVKNEIQVLVDAVRQLQRQGESIITKVIGENCFLTDEQKMKVYSWAREAGADFIKTSTGFGPGGATTEDIKLMRKIVGPDMGIKAAGGIRTLEYAANMIKAAELTDIASYKFRIGTSAGPAIVGEYKAESAAPDARADGGGAAAEADTAVRRLDARIKFYLSRADLRHYNKLYTTELPRPVILDCTTNSAFKKLVGYVLPTGAPFGVVVKTIKEAEEICSMLFLQQDDRRVASVEQYLESGVNIDTATEEQYKDAFITAVTELSECLVNEYLSISRITFAQFYTAQTDESLINTLLARYIETRTLSLTGEKNTDVRIIVNWFESMLVKVGIFAENYARLQAGLKALAEAV